QLALQRHDLARDGALRERQLLRGAGVALMPCGGLETGQGLGGRQGDAHAVFSCDGPAIVVRGGLIHEVHSYLDACKSLAAGRWAALPWPLSGRPLRPCLAPIQPGALSMSS